MAAKRPGRAGGARKPPTKAEVKAGESVAAAKKRAAAAAARKAKAAGAVGTRSTTGELLKGKHRHLRDTAIVTRVEAGWSVQDAAREFGVSRRTAAAAVERSRAERSPLDSTPMELVERILRRAERRMLGFEALAVKYENVNPSAAVGAAKAAGEEDRLLVAMLIEIGKMPKDLEVFRTQAEVGHLMGELMDRLDAFEGGQLTAADVAEYVRDVVTGATPLYGDAIEGSETESDEEASDGDGDE